MGAMERRLRRLEDRLTPEQRDYLQNPRERMRVVVSGVPSLDIPSQPASCTRRLSADGTLTEIVMLPSRLSDEELEAFIQSFPVEPE